MIQLLNISNLNKTVLSIKGVRKTNKETKPLQNRWLWNDQSPIYWNKDTVILIKN